MSPSLRKFVDGAVFTVIVYGIVCFCALVTQPDLSQHTVSFFAFSLASVANMLRINR